MLVLVKLLGNLSIRSLFAETLNSLLCLTFSVYSIIYSKYLGIQRCLWYWNNCNIPKPCDSATSLNHDHSTAMLDVEC